MKKKKKQARIRNSIILAVLVVAAFVGLKLASSDKYAQTRTDVLEKYLSYTDTDAVTYEDYLESTNGDYISDSAEEITVKAADYKTAEMDDLKKDGEIVWTAGEGTITYEFDVKEAGWYNVRLTYYTDTDSTQNIVRNIRVNDTRLFDGCDGVTFSRLWMDDNKDWLMNTDGNQAAPTQIQSEGPAVCSITSADVDSIGAYRFFLEKGKNTISFESVQAKLGISEIALVPAKEIVSYAEYFDTLTKEGAQIIDANEVDGGAVMIQAEDTTLKSSSSLSPNNDRTSVKTVPYDPTYIIYNTIGGSNWASVGQSMTWTVDAPKAGFYKIGMRFKQYLNRGFISPRYLTINGELPFAEAAETQFAYDPDWVTGYLSGEDGDYYFYLNEGENTISMTATLGELTDAVDLVSESVNNLNDLYREITAITGTSPDLYRDYSIMVYLPELTDVLEVEYTRLNAVMGMFGEEYGSANKTSALNDMMDVMIKLIKQPNDVAKYLSNFSDSLSALADWVTSINDLPLELDYLAVCGDGYKLPKANGNFFENLAHTWNSFMGSFTNDFKVHTESDDSKDRKQLDVWVTVDTRTEYDIIQKLINAAYADSEYDINLSMVQADTLLPATVAGNGPDVAIQASYSMPTNFAYRNAAYDLTQFDDFDEVFARFPEGVRSFLEYEGGVYGFPDQLSFPVLIYRTDILEAAGLKVPETWDDLTSMIPYLEADNMSVYLASNEYLTLGGSSSSTTMPVNAIFLSMLYQKGYELYNEDNTATNLDQTDLMMVFKDWTEYYTNQGLEYSVNLTTRFRTGEIPVMVGDYSYINTLSISAPEISGKWSIAKIPGTRQADGSVDHTAAAMIGTSFIVSSTVEKDGMLNEAWDFLKWWTSAQTQANYSIELKAEDGEAAEYPVANIDAIKDGGLKDEFKEVVLGLIDDLKAEPQIPGSYITGRTIRNAFVTTVSDNVDPIDTLYITLDAINTEITNKRQEFGLNTAQE